MSLLHLKRVMAMSALVVLVATSASAALSQKYKEWRDGPEQWIMTAEEQRAWKQVKTDEEAIEFIDLFWVRRDPTPQTAKNEFRDEFGARVRFSDAKFADRGRRGALSDRGRVFIVLGNPTKSTSALGYSSFHALGSQTGNIGNPSGGSRLRGGTDTWTWDREDAAKFDMPKIEVVFVEQLGSSRVNRDPHRPDVMSAMPVAIRNAVVNPDITSVPAWAPRGGLEPKILVVTETPVSPEGAAAAPRVAAVIGGAIPASPGTAAQGALSRLTFLRDVYSIETEVNFDPFSRIESAAAFKVNEELGWAAQYCAPGVEEPMVRFTLRLTGRAGNEVIDRLAPPDEMMPDRMRAVDGCFMLRGLIPLEGMSAGDYELELTTLDAAGIATATVRQAFRIE